VAPPLIYYHISFFDTCRSPENLIIASDELDSVLAILGTSLREWGLGPPHGSWLDFGCASYARAAGEGPR